MSYTDTAFEARGEGYKSLLGGDPINPAYHPVLAKAAKALSKGYKKEDLKKDVGNTNDAQLLYIDGGLFTDCCLSRPVLNLTLNPTRSLGNMIPVVRRNTQKSKYAFLTDIAEPTGALAAEPCDDPQQVGDIAACFLELEKGRQSFMSKTLELDAIIRRLCEGITTDLYLVGDVRGVSARVPTSASGNLSLVAGGAVRRQMQLIGRALQRSTLKQFWSGDPTNGALNTNGSKQFWGLDFLIADDYGTAAKPFVTGTQCEKLNSDIKDFDSCIGAANATTGIGLYGYMQELEDTLFNKASYHGYSSVEWVWVMHPTLWSAIVKYLPCELLDGSCSTVPNNSPGIGQIVSDGVSIAALRNQLTRTMSLDVNGRNYRVVLDDALPVTVTAGPPVTHTGSIYFVPLSVEGEPVLFWESANYSELTQALAPIPGGLGGMLGWSDSGLFLWAVENRNYCFNIRVKDEIALYFIAPHLAGKVQNVSACNLQEKVFPVLA